MRVVIHRSALFVAAALSCMAASAADAGELGATADLAAILESARARQHEIVATVKTHAHRQHQQEQVRGGRGRVRAEGLAVHAVRPRAGGRFELSRLKQEATGETSELDLSPPAQVRSDPNALTTAEAIARVLDWTERLQVVGRTTLDGRDAWLLELESVSKRKDSKDLKERVRRASRGRLWVAVADGAVLRLETELVRPVNLLGGRVRRATVIRDQGPGPEGCWVPTASDAVMEMSILTIERTTTTRTTFEAWEPAPPKRAEEPD